MTIGTSIWGLPGCGWRSLDEFWWFDAVTERSAGRCRRVRFVVIVVVLMLVDVVMIVDVGRVAHGVQDGTWIGGAHRRHRAGVVLVDGVRRAVLEVGDRRMLGMRGQQIVDELLDDLAPPQRRADVVPTTFAVEVLHELLVAAVALLAPLHLG